ncbi:MAG: hypothetical protein ACRD3T_20525 [Terriglobia bacterium]
MLRKTLSPLRLLGMLAAVAPGAAWAETLAAVSFNVGSPGQLIPNDFDGFSIEVDDSANKYLGVAGSPNVVFYQLLENLGKSVIRIGGDRTDYSWVLFRRSSMKYAPAIVRPRVAACEKPLETILRCFLRIAGFKFQWDKAAVA